MQFGAKENNRWRIRRLRWWPAVTIAVVGAAGFAAVQAGFFQISSRPVMDSLLIVATAGLLLAAWIALFAPMRLIARARWLVILAALQVALLEPLWCLIWCYALRRDSHGSAPLRTEKAGKASAHVAEVVTASGDGGGRYGASLHRFAAERIGLHRIGPTE